MEWSGIRVPKTSPERRGFVTEPPARKKHSTLGAPDSTIRMARELRKKMTLPEVLLWQQLQKRPGGYRFRKQHPLGRHALDFACIRARLAIEVDGAAHDRGDRPERDAERDAIVLQQGFETLRIPAAKVLQDIESVVTHIVATCCERAKPSPPREGNAR